MPFDSPPNRGVPAWDETTDPLPPDLGRTRAMGQMGVPRSPRAAPGAANALPPLPNRPMPMRGRSAATPPPAPRLPNAPLRAPYAPARSRRVGRVVRLGLLVTLAVALIALLTAGARFYAFGQAISKQAPLSSQTGYVGGSGRVNLLVLGYGGVGHDGAYLTDSLMVISLIPHDGATTMISVPRDLWVQVPPGSGQYAKINTAYADGFTNGFGGLPAGRDAAGAEAANKVSDVLGMNVPYWLSLDFNGFRQLVDALGGVDINVPTAFTARYPANDDPSIDASWTMIHFDKGPQHMNGERAIEYARARYVLDPVSEGSDFARSVRQQLLVKAIVSRAKQPSAWGGLSGATDALQKALYTNLSLADLSLFSSKLDLNSATKIGLTNQNVLVSATAGDGEDILQPANGDWDAIKQYVAQNLKS